MTLSPTVPGVLLFVICFASSAAASHDDPAYTPVANNARIKNLVHSSSWRSTVRHRFPSNWTMRTRNVIHSGRKKDTSHSIKNSYLSAQVKYKMVNHFKNRKRRDEKTSLDRLPRSVRHGDRASENWNHLQRTMTTNPSLMLQKRDLPLLNLFRSQNRTFLFKKDRDIDIASSDQESRDIHEDPFGGPRYTPDGRWATRKLYPRKPTRDPRRPTPRPYATSPDTLALVGIFAGGGLAMVLFSVGLWYCIQHCRKNCDKDDAAARRSGSSGGPPCFACLDGLAARLRAAPGSRPRPASPWTPGRGEGPSAPAASDHDGLASAPGVMRYSDLLLEDSRRFEEYLNPLTAGDERADAGPSSSTGTYSGTAWRPASGGDRPPDYAEVATADLISGRSTNTYDVVIRRPEEPPPPIYDVAYVRAGDAPTPPGDASATSKEL